MNSNRKKNLLEAIDEVHELPQNKSRFKTLYYMLDVVDGKASALLTFNGVIIASFALLADSCLGFVWGAYIGILFSLLACVFCLSVAKIDWSFLGQESIEREFKLLAERVDERTKRYRFAFTLSFGSMIMLAFTLISSLILPMPSHCY